MRILGVLVLLVVVGGAVVALSRGGESSPSPPTPDELLRRSDEAMAAISSLRVRYTVYPPPPSSPEVPYEWPEYYEVEILDARCVRTDNDSLACSCRSNPEVWPFFDRSQGGLVYSTLGPGATPLEKLRITGVGLIGGRMTWVIDYEFQQPGDDGPLRVKRREWIDKETHRLLRQDEEHLGPSGPLGSLRADLDRFNLVVACG